MGFRNDIRKAVLLGGSLLLLIFTTSVGAAAQTWVKLAPVGTPPPSIGPGVFDTANDRMIVFGGDIFTVWVLSNANGLGGTAQWSHFGTHQDPFQGFPRSGGPSAVYDQTNNRLITFGGCLANCGVPVNDVWVLTNANGIGGTPTWLKLLPIGVLPPPSADHAAVYDASSNKMIVFGGQNGCCSPPVAFGAVWVLSNANGLGGTPTWTMLNPSGGPPQGQADPTAVYDPASNQMTVFGGQRNGAFANTNAVWVLSDANGSGGAPAWTNLIAEGSAGAPAVRNAHSAVYDPIANRMTIFGGRDAFSNTFFNDTWVLSNANGLGVAAWTQLHPTGGLPAAREVAVVGLDVASNRMIISGGEDSAGVFTDTWVLTGANGIVTPADMAVFKGTDDEEVQTGRTLTYGIAVANFGPGTASGVLVTDRLPSGTAFVSAEFAAGSCTNINGRLRCSESTPPTPCSFTNGTVTCNVGSLAPFTFANPTGAVVRLVVKFTAPAGSRITNTAEVSASNPDPHPANNSSRVTTTVTH